MQHFIHTTSVPSGSSPYTEPSTSNDLAPHFIKNNRRLADIKKQDNRIEHLNRIKHRPFILFHALLEVRF